MKVVAILPDKDRKASTNRVTVKLIADYGQYKAGQVKTCHPNLVPILIEKGVIADSSEANTSDKAKPAKVQKVAKPAKKK